MQHSVENVSRPTGTAHTPAAAFEVSHSIFDTLAKQHAEAVALLKQAQCANNPDQQRQLWETCRVELLSHERAEVLVLYQAIARQADPGHIPERHEAEAPALETAIENVDAASYGTQAWLQRLDALRTLVYQHVAEEEKVLFRQALELLGDETALALDQEYRQTQRKLLGELLRH